MRPDLIWHCKGNAAEIHRSALGNPDAFEPCREGAFDSFRAALAESAIDLPTGMPPMAAGLFGSMSYDMVRLMETLPDATPDMPGVPDGLFLPPTVIAVYDTIDNLVSVVPPLRSRTALSHPPAIAAALRGPEVT